jgi:hypothetical protein
MWIDELDEEERDWIIDELEENGRRLERGELTWSQFWDAAAEIAFAEDPRRRESAREWIRGLEKSGHLGVIMTAARLELDVPPARPGDN